MQNFWRETAGISWLSVPEGGGGTNLLREWKDDLVLNRQSQFDQEYCDWAWPRCWKEDETCIK